MQPIWLDKFIYYLRLNNSTLIKKPALRKFNAGFLVDPESVIPMNCTHNFIIINNHKNILLQHRRVELRKSHRTTNEPPNKNNPY